MLRLWWNRRIIIHLGFVIHNETLSAHLYVHQLKRVHKNLVKKQAPCDQQQENVCCLPWRGRTAYSKNKTGNNFGTRLVCSTPSTLFAWPCTKKLLLFSIVAKCCDGGKSFSHENQIQDFVEEFSHQNLWNLLTILEDLR